MSRIFLISSNTIVDPYPVYPLGMAVVASALSSQGHLVEQFDYLAASQSPELLCSALSGFKPDFVGISLRNMDTVDSTAQEDGWSLQLNKELIRKVREISDCPIVLGGPAFSIMPEAIIDYVEADYGIVGEGEFAFHRLIEQIKEGTRPCRVIRSLPDSFVEINSSQPFWKKELMTFYGQQGGIMGLQTKRGCAHGCAYCTYPALEGDALRCMAPARVADEVERLLKDFRLQSLFFTDSVFNDSIDHHLSVAEELVRRDLPIRWSAFFRPGPINREALRLLKRSGLQMIELGTDAATDVTLAGLKKGFSFQEVVDFNQICLDEEIPCLHYVMFGCPGETDLTMNEAFRNLESLKNAWVMAFSGIRILPGTALHERSIEEGVLAPDDSLLRPVYYFSPGVDRIAMNEMIHKAFAGRRDRIFPPSEGYRRLRAVNLFGFRSILGGRRSHG